LVKHLFILEWAKKISHYLKSVFSVASNLTRFMMPI